MTPPTATKATVPKKTRAFAQTRVKPTTTDTKFSSDGKSGFLGFNANEVVESDDEANEPTNPKRRRSDSLEHRTQMQQRSSRDSSSIDDDTSIPNATKWSSDQVYKYFKNKFPRHAHVFKDHEIDGPSLYLLKRGDIIKGFNLKIGPALKIYGHVQEIQLNRKDLTLSWQ